jgi:inner membrane protein
MDPVTHALAGAVIAYSVCGREHTGRALLLGATAAVLPDLDVLIRSSSDPLLAIEHHRGFTHSLAVSLPAGAIVGAFVARNEMRSRRAAVVAGALAWTSHGLLDAATTYGTQLLWPFSRLRVSLDVISIIDPLFTIVLAIAVIAAMRSQRALVVGCMAIAAAWLVVGAVQRERAIDAQRELASRRRTNVVRGAVFPTIGNRVVWRSLYESNGVLHMDRIRVPWFGQSSSFEVARVPSLAPVRSKDRRIRRDLERFIWFSDGWVARDPTDPTVIGDARYSLNETGWQPVWGIRFREGGDPPTQWVDRTRQRRLRDLTPLR